MKVFYCAFNAARGQKCQGVSIGFLIDDETSEFKSDFMLQFPRRVAATMEKTFFLKKHFIVIFSVNQEASDRFSGVRPTRPL